MALYQQKPVTEAFRVVSVERTRTGADSGTVKVTLDDGRVIEPGRGIFERCQFVQPGDFYYALQHVQNGKLESYFWQFSSPEDFALQFDPAPSEPFSFTGRYNDSNKQTEAGVSSEDAAYADLSIPNHRLDWKTKFARQVMLIERERCAKTVESFFGDINKEVSTENRTVVASINATLESAAEKIRLR